MEVQKIPLSVIHPSPMNPRKTFDSDALAELADNIEKQGLLQPITIRPIREGNPLYNANWGRENYEIVCGERRYRAMMTLSRRWSEMDAVAPKGSSFDRYSDILAIIRDMNDDEAFEAMITENLQRKDVDPMEEAFAFGELAKKGKSYEEIATRFGKSVRFVAERVKLNSLVPELMHEIKEGNLPIVSAQMVCKLDAEQQRQYYKQQKDRYQGLYKAATESYIDNLFMKIDTSAWAKMGDPDFKGGCKRMCSECQMNTANHGCLFYEMKPDGAGKCTDRAKFQAKSEEFVLYWVRSHSSELVRKDESLEYGKTVVAIPIDGYETAETREYKSKLRDIILSEGYEVVNPSETFDGKCWYTEDDERLIEKIKNGEVYRVANLFKFSSPDIEVQWWNVKRKRENGTSDPSLPVAVNKLLSEIKSLKEGLRSKLTTECAKTISANSTLTDEPLTDLEKKLFCLLVIKTLWSVKTKLGINMVAPIEADYKFVEEHPDIFEKCVRGWLQDCISLGHNQELHQAEPLLDEIGAQWCAEQYLKTKEKTIATHEKKIAKLTEELKGHGYDADGNPIPKVETLQLPEVGTLPEQYNAMKKKHPDAILLLRVGDFYETFDTDAEAIAEILNITSTSSQGNKLAGFPHHALDTYLPKILRAGKRVAICEQLDEAKKSK